MWFKSAENSPFWVRNLRGSLTLAVCCKIVDISKPGVELFATPSFEGIFYLNWIKLRCYRDASLNCLLHIWVSKLVITTAARLKHFGVLECFDLANKEWCEIRTRDPKNARVGPCFRRSLFLNPCTNWRKTANSSYVFSTSFAGCTDGDQLAFPLATSSFTRTIRDTNTDRF